MTECLHTDLARCSQESAVMFNGEFIACVTEKQCYLAMCNGTLL